MTTATEISSPPARPWGVYFAAIVLFAATVAYTVYACEQMAGGMDMPGGWRMSMMWMPMSGQSLLGAAWMFIAMWTAMMIAMMLPSVMPMILRYRREMAFHHATFPGLRSALMISGYFIVWAAFGALTFIIGTLIARAEMSSPALSRHVPTIAGACLIICGIYQWTSWKTCCLNHCRDPISPMTGQLHGGWGSSLMLGLHQGLACALCCWSLMLIQAILGMMNLFVMAAIAFVIAVEKMLPGGRVMARIAGAIAAAAGLLFIARGAGMS